MIKNINMTIGILISALFLLIYNLSYFSYQCNNVRNDTIRLHIIASSDSEIDQEIKLKIRDELLNKSEEIFEESIAIENAKKKIIQKLPEIKNITDNILKENDMNYISTVSFEKEYFDTRIYENGITLPAGKYLALKIKLGNGNGKNWWCIMFPALCLPCAETNHQNQAEMVYSDSEKDIIFTNNKYEIKFKIIEYIEKIKDVVDNRVWVDNAYSLCI